MSKRFIRVTAMILVLMTVFSVPAAAAAASNPVQPRSDAYIAAYFAAIGSYSKGTVTVTFETTGTGTMDSIGATAIYVYPSNSTQLAGSLFSSYTASMLGHYTIGHGNSYTFPATSGQKYYAVVYCYAAKNGGSSTRIYETSYTTAL